MSPHALTRPVAFVVGSLVMALAVSGCASGFTPQTSPSVQPADANNYPALGNTSPIAIRAAFVLGPEPGEDAYVKGSDAAVYLTLINQTKKTDTLVSASSPAAREVPVSAGGTGSGTSASAGIEVPPTDSTVARGAPVAVGQPPYSTNTITLTKLTQDLRNTEVISLTLRFRRAGKMTFDVPVMPRTGAYATLQPAPSSTATPIPKETPTASATSPTPAT